MFLSIRHTARKNHTGKCCGAIWREGLAFFRCGDIERVKLLRYFSKTLDAKEISKDEATAILEEAGEAVSTVDGEVSAQGRAPAGTADEREGDGGPEAGSPGPEAVAGSDARSENLREVIRALDKDEDENWTEGGLPRVDTVCAYLGENVTREDIEAALPGFSRSDA